MVKRRCTFKNLEENLKNLDEILKTWKKFRKPGKNFQKTYGHPEYVRNTTKGIYSQRKILDSEVFVWLYLVTVFCCVQLVRLIKLKKQNQSIKMMNYGMCAKTIKNKI